MTIRPFGESVHSQENQSNSIDLAAVQVGRSLDSPPVERILGLYGLNGNVMVGVRDTIFYRDDSPRACKVPG